MRGLPSILSLYLNEFNKFNVRSYFSYDIKITFKSHLLRKISYKCVLMYATLLWVS